MPPDPSGRPIRYPPTWSGAGSSAASPGDWGLVSVRSSPPRVGASSRNPQNGQNRIGWSAVGRVWRQDGQVVGIRRLLCRGSGGNEAAPPDRRGLALTSRFGQDSMAAAGLEPAAPPVPPAAVAAPVTHAPAAVTGAVAAVPAVGPVRGGRRRRGAGGRDRHL